ncbi:unnamed protein product [Nesidiocoris tenuis]|uniref:Uncharacterized protein n=1 Tax=Nesidiocoris tenuis TaxID=355587 RepID=A0A6H5GFN7_9HEMI|nr:unnamed protein product [Nesidiocoris tenuis]
MPYTVEQVSTYPVHVPLKIPIKVHHPEGQFPGIEGINEQNLQQLDWMEANHSPQKVAIKGFEPHQANNFRPSMPNRQPFSGAGFRQMPMHYNRGNGVRLPMTRNPMRLPFMVGQGYNVPSFNPKPMSYNAPQALHVPFRYQSSNVQPKTQYPIQTNVQQTVSSYKVNEVPSESWTGYVQKPDDTNGKLQFPAQLHHLNAQSHTQISDPFKSQMTNTSTVTAPGPGESPTSFRVSQTVLHAPSTPLFQPLIQQPHRHQPFSLKTASQSAGHLKWSPELHVPSSTFFKQSFPSGQNSSAEVKETPQQPKIANTFSQYEIKYNSAFQPQKTGASNFPKISVSPMATALTAQQTSSGQSKTHIGTSSNAQTTNSYLGNAQQLTKDKPSTDPQQPISYFGSKTILGENELSYSSSISHGRNNGTPS